MSSVTEYMKNLEKKNFGIFDKLGDYNSILCMLESVDRSIEYLKDEELSDLCDNLLIAIKERKRLLLKTEVNE